MGLLRSALNVADHRGGRWILSAASTRLAHLLGSPLRIHHDGEFWLYSSNGVTLPRGRKFDFYDYDLRTMPGRIRQFVREAEDCWFHVYRPSEGDVIVDVGAEIGTDTVVFARAVGPTGKVIAIEAQPQTYELLLRTCESNGLANVVPLNVAVADAKREERISSGAGLESNFIGVEDGEVVQADTLDNLLRDLPRIDLLKMNIEGAEQLAIKAMEETLEKTAYLAIACHDFVDPESAWFRTMDKVAAYLTGKGFTIVTRDSDERVYVRYHLHAFRPGKSPRSLASNRP